MLMEALLNGHLKLPFLLLGLSAAFLGRWVEKVGPKVSGTTAGLF